ncbi:MAG: threonine aldolase family protein [Acidimicrobiales bacterium]
MPASLIDLRSDTVTRPTEQMRRAMAHAEVGDDGYGEDPTVRALEEAFAQRVGKPAALFVPSGTMGNQIALRLLGRPATAVVLGRRQHPLAYEHGASGVNGSYQLHAVDDDDGTLDPDELAELVAGVEHHWLPVSAVCVENAHMPAGGVPWPIERLAAVAAVGVPVHLDGARLFNASVATGITPAAYAAHAATVMCCLSKGLGAPVGSLLAGPRDLLDEARHERKRLGGEMRQAGIVAAAGLVALEHHVERLADDHARARRLAEAVAERWTGCIDLERVVTNCVVFRHEHPPGLIAHLLAEDVLAGTIAARTVRFMTHIDVDDTAIDRAVDAVRSAP